MKFINGSLSKQEIIKRGANGNKCHQRIHKILLDAPGLNSAQFASKPVCDICRTIAKESIDNGQVKVVTDEGTKPIRNRIKDMQDTVNQAQVHPFVDERFGKPVCRFDK